MTKIPKPKYKIGDVVVLCEKCDVRLLPDDIDIVKEVTHQVLVEGASYDQDTGIWSYSLKTDFSNRHYYEEGEILDKL